MRYDGHSTQTFQIPGIEDTGLPVARIVEVFVGPAQHVWAAGFDGRVFKFSPGRGQFELFGEISNPSIELQEAKYDGRTGLWMGFSNGSCLTFDIETKSIRHRCRGLTSPIVDFFFNSESALVLSEDGHVLKIDGSSSL